VNVYDGESIITLDQKSGSSTATSLAAPVSPAATNDA